MNNPFFFLIILLPVAGFLLDRYLDHLNRTMWSEQLPEQLRDICPEEKYRQSQLYHRENDRLSLLSSIVNLVVLLTMIIFGGFALLDSWSGCLVNFNPILTALLFFAFIGIASALMDVPFSYYHIFHIEKKYEFNKTNKTTFFVDLIKSLFITIVIGAPILFLITWFYYKAGPLFWLYAWGLITVFSLLMNFFYSELIVPLFNKQTPLADGPLRNKILEFSDSTGFEIKDIFVIDGSKRSTKSNAYFAGFGAKKRIVLYDTLLDDLTDEEIVAVLAHEIGHFKKKHIFLQLALSVVLNGIMLFLFSLVVDNPSFSFALGAETASFHMGLIVFGMLYSPLSMATNLISNYISRRNEFVADKFSADNNNPEELANALKKLSVKNLSNMMPHPTYVFFHYSHPPLLERLEKLL